MTKDGEKSHVQECKARQIFASFYVEHCTLLQFLRKIDQSKESDLILQHGDHPDYQYLLKTTIAAVPGPEQASSQWPAFKPRYTQWRTLGEIIHRVIENVCRSNTSINVLAYGYGPLSGYNRHGTVAGTSGIQNSYPNTIVSYLRTAKPWQILHQRIGDDLMIHLLQNVALFIKMPSSKCYLQVAGHPISRLIPLSEDASPHISGNNTATSSEEKIGETEPAKRKTRRGGKRYQRFCEKANTSAMGDHTVTFGNLVMAEVDMEATNSDAVPTYLASPEVVVTHYEHGDHTDNPSPPPTISCKGIKRRFENCNHFCSDRCTVDLRVKMAKTCGNTPDVCPVSFSDEMNQTAADRLTTNICSVHLNSHKAAVAKNSVVFFPNKTGDKFKQPLHSHSEAIDVCCSHGVAQNSETVGVLSHPQRGSLSLLPMEMTKSSTAILSGDKAVARCCACIQKHEGMETVALRDKLWRGKKRKPKIGKECENSKVLPRGKPWNDLAKFLPQPCLPKTITNESKHRKQERSKKQVSKRKESTVNNPSRKIQIPLNEIYLPHSQLFYASNLSQKFPKNHVMEFASVSVSGARKLIQNIFLTKGLFGGSANSSVEKVRQEKDDQNAKNVKGVEVSAKDACTEQRFCNNNKRRHFRLPRRFIQMQPLFIKFLARHRRCPFQTVLRQHCFYAKRGVRVLKSKKQKRAIVLSSKRKLCKKSLQKRQKGLLSQMTRGVNVAVYRHAVNNYTSHSKVERLLQCICHKVVPRELWGSPENKKVFFRNLGKFVRLHRGEKFSLSQMMTGIKVSHFEWLKRKLKGKGTHKVPLSESFKQQELSAKFIWWFVTQYLMVLLKSFFYITESVANRQKVFFYRKPVWRDIHQFGLKTFSSKFFKALTSKDAEKLLVEKSCLGYSLLRFLPKSSTVRPITNMKHCLPQKEMNGQKQQSVNRKLKNLFEVLKFEKERNPENLGAALLGIDDLYKVLRDFVVRQRSCQENKPLYFIRADVNHCYESIVQQKLFDVMEDVLEEEEYLIRRFALLRMSAGKVHREFLKDVTTADDCRLFPDFFHAMIETQGLKEVVAVDQVWYANEDRSKLLEMLHDHIFNNIVKIGSQYYRQTSGIAQGSVLSPLLCSYFYGHMEKTCLSAISQESDSLLLRWVDDFLLITPIKRLAENFVTLMHAGIPEYGCHINHEKTLTNFDVVTADGLKVKRIDGDEKLPWCGFLVDQRTLEVCIDWSRFAGSFLRDTLTVSLDAHPAQALHRKLLLSVRPKCHPLLLDHNLNSRENILLNVYQTFLLAAHKFHAYSKELPRGRQPKDNPSFFCKMILDLAQYFYSTSSRKCRHLSCSEVIFLLDEQEVTWLCLHAFQACLRRKQTRYKEVLSFLKAGLSRLFVAGDVWRVVEPSRNTVFKTIR